MKSYDVVIIGSGIGGLCCGSLLALKGKKVLICEAHNRAGGVAHSFNFKGYKFESGPSLWSGLEKGSTINPLGQILNILNEDIEIIKYNSWRILFPEGKFNLKVGKEPFRKLIKEIRGNTSVEECEGLLIYFMDMKVDIVCFSL